jgi:DNA-binding NtrC family response regulator
MIENRTILLLDTDPISREAIRAVLIGCGYAVFEARHMRDAAALLDNSSRYIHVIVAAVNSLDESVVAFVEQASDSRRDIAIVYLADCQSAAMVSHRSRHSVIEMPVGVKTLNNAIRTALSAAGTTSVRTTIHAPLPPA